MKKALLATMVALISIQAGATMQSTCKNKAAGGMFADSNIHSRLLPGGKSVPVKTVAPVRANGAK